MTISMLAKAAVVWLFILMLAILNGILREKALVPVFGERSGLIASGVILALGILVVAFFAAPWYDPMQSLQWLAIGLLWLLLTLAFEFGFGRLVQHKAWDDLLNAYTFQGGNLWPLVLVVTLFAPWVAAWVRDMS